MLSPETFREYLFSKCGFSETSTLFVGVSGGLDSVVLCDLLQKNKIEFGIAHVNYGLREKESDDDADFVAELARKCNVPFYLKKCGAEDFSNTGENSIQFSARKIRYDFFDFISQTQGFQNIATAHHLDDAIETALLNFARGSGVAGLRSIQPRNGNIIRPLLFTNRSEILKYAEENKIVWREDSSNETDKYSRNRFRHHLLPWLMTEIPQGYSGFESSFSKLRSTEEFISASLLNWENQCCKTSENEISISISEMNKFPNAELFLKFFLLENGFSESNLISLSDLLVGETGKQLIVENAKIIRDRNNLVLICSSNAEKQNPENHFEFKEEVFDGKIISDFCHAVVDSKSVQLPLQIRQWKSGDQMIPFGMNGKKNVSDILNELKIPVYKKRNLQCVFSGEEIVWIPGYRIADKFKVTEKTSSVIKLFYKS